MKVSLIAAMDRNRLIAGPNGLPWHLPRDIAHFRRFTQGKFMLVGRRTFEQMQGWFTSQVPIVLTSQTDYPHSLCAASVDEAVALAQNAGAEELVISGGRQVYMSALDYCDEMILTLIDDEFAGTVYFPAYAANEWEEVSRANYPPDDTHACAMAIVLLRRLNNLADN